MSAVILCIGLNVGDMEPAHQLTDTLGALTGAGLVLDLAIGRGEWEGVPERFVQARVRNLAGDWRRACEIADLLRQECIAFRREGNTADWVLCYADGTTTAGYSLAENPVILPSRRNAADARADMERDAETRSTRGADHIGHSSVQAWSAGPFFPAVIHTRERYAPGRSAADSTPVVTHVLTLNGRAEEYATYRDAESVARWLCQNGRVNTERFAAWIGGHRHG